MPAFHSFSGSFSVFIGFSRLQPEREWRFVEVDVAPEEAEEERDRIRGLMYPSCTIMDLSISIAIWFAARGQGPFAPTACTCFAQLRFTFSNWSFARLPWNDRQNVSI
jgi:hypothetical protein